ncbi:MAG: signal peptide peptidase SppA [Candidatus Bathyanammoxibius sp.]
MTKDGGFMVFLLVAVAVATLGGCAVNVPLIGKVKPLEEQVVSGEGTDKVLVVDISGIISDRKRKGVLRLSSRPSMVANVKEVLKKAREDDDIKAVVLRINSPGGTVTASDIIYHEIEEFKKEKGVAVVACIVGLGTSGGYYVAVSADRIVALPTSILGSIGVILLKLNMEGLMEKIGVQDEVIISGDKKDAALPFHPLSPEERALLQEIIDSLYRRFVLIVETARPEADLQDHKEFLDGRVFTAQQALEIGLVDELGYLEDAIELAKKRAGIEKARVIMYKRPESYRNNIYSLGEGDAPDATGFIGSQLNGLGRALHPDFMYLWIP